MSKYKKARTKPYKADDTKEALKGRLKRQHNRILALETHLNHHFLMIRKSLRDFEKSEDYDPEKYKGKTFLWCIIENIPIVLKQKPLTDIPVEEKLYFAGDIENNKRKVEAPNEANNKEEVVEGSDEPRPPKLYDSFEDAYKDDIKDGELTPVYEFTYINCVNTFISKDAAEKHLKKYYNSYTNPKVVSMTPLENDEMTQVIKHFYHLGEVVPDCLSVWEELEESNYLETKVQELEKQIEIYEQTLEQKNTTIEELQEICKNLQEVITIKREGLKNGRKKAKN